MELCLKQTAGFARTAGELRKALLRFAAKSVLPFSSGESREALNQRAGEILDRCGNNILRFAHSYPHNMSDAEEVLQDALLQLLRKSPALENRSHEKAWLLLAPILQISRLDTGARRMIS